MDRMPDQPIARAYVQERLGVAENQMIVRALQSRHALDDVALSLSVKVDDDVAAQNDIERTSHRPVIHEIETAEGDQLPHLRAHTILARAADALKPTHQPSAIDFLQSLAVVDPPPRLLEYVAVDVGGQDTDAPAPQVSERLERHHGSRIGFFSTRAAGRPDANTVPAVVVAFDGRQQSVGEELEVIRLAEEGGEVGGQSIAEVLQLLGVAPL